MCFESFIQLQAENKMSEHIVGVDRFSTIEAALLHT